MVADMIKPFKIIHTRKEEDGGTGVIFEVSKVVGTGANTSTLETMQTYMLVPDGQDVDAYLFEQLSKAGWF